MDFRHYQALTYDLGGIMASTKKVEPDIGFKTGDRVVRAETKGPLGTVQNVRIETVRTSIKEGAEAPGVTVTVLWDNGTLSHFIPEGIEKV